jgi:hypothetical protein
MDISVYGIASGSSTEKVVEEAIREISAPGDLGDVIMVADPPPSPTGPVIQLMPDGRVDDEDYRQVTSAAAEATVRAKLTPTDELSAGALKESLERLAATGHDIELVVT